MVFFSIIFKTPQFRQFSVHPNKWSVIRISRMASLNLIAPNHGLIWPQDTALFYLEIKLTDGNNLAFGIFWLKRRTDQHDMMWFQIAGMKLILWPTAIIFEICLPVYCYTNYLWHAASQILNRNSACSYSGRCRCRGVTYFLFAGSTAAQYSIHHGPNTSIKDHSMFVCFPSAYCLLSRYCELTSTYFILSALQQWGLPWTL